MARTDIFASCTADNVRGQPGRNFPQTSIEPNLAINPANPRNLLVGAQMDRWSNGAARGLRGAYSLDGGSSWRITSTPGVTKCQNGPWPRSSDPWVSFSPDGTAYFSSLVTEKLDDPDIFGHNGQTISRSTDGGATWSQPTTLIDTPREPDANRPQVLNDKNSVTADPRDSRYVYVVWDKVSCYIQPCGNRTDEGGGEGRPQSAPANAQRNDDVLTMTRRTVSAARRRQAEHPISEDAQSTYPNSGIGPALLARTTNHGRTWEKPRVIYDPGPNKQTIGNQIVALSDGRLADFFTWINNLTGATAIGLVTSSDHGATWSRPDFPFASVSNPAVTPNKHEDIRSADLLFSVTSDRVNGNVYLAWEDSRFSGVSESVVAFSADNGYSWSQPVRVNQTPRNPSHPLFQQALIPTVATTQDGTAVVTYYDFRKDTVGATTDLADSWAVSCNPLTSKNTCQDTSDWRAEVRLTVWSFDYNRAPDAGGHFLGDYMSAQSVGQRVHAIFGVAEAVNSTALYTRTLDVPVSQGARHSLIASGK